MRLLTALAFASGVLALATGPVQPLADRQTVQDDASLDPDNAVDLALELPPWDKVASSSELEKREPSTSATVRFPGPDEGDPSAVVIAGISITFIMAYRYVMRQGERVRDHYVMFISYHNQNAGRVAIQAVGNGVRMLDQHIERDGRGLILPPAGVNNFLLVVRRLFNNEL
ncbi:hypothetical protein E4U13_006737 [Claviceps humidiphila]|uniref:Uncharacterized protein n=1 Tax=Claviceps humidiphila TaxID=1294629 RepID=A0A9P7TUE1_9HYPO|nr:hypothetical protein E4U13_006737 [Claviceps humidiphila]